MNLVFFLRLARVRGELRKVLVAVVEVHQQVGLVALAVRLELRRTGGRRQLGESEVPGELEREQLVLLVVRLEQPVARHVPAGVEREIVVDRARPDVLLLVVVRQVGGDRVGDVPQQGRAAVNVSSVSASFTLRRLAATAAGSVRSGSGLETPGSRTT